MKRRNELSLEMTDLLSLNISRQCSQPRQPIGVLFARSDRSEYLDSDLQIFQSRDSMSLRQNRMDSGIT